jgi:hypothetical protein
MIVVMRRDATETQIQSVIDKLVSQEFDIHRSTGAERTILGAVGSRTGDPRDFEKLEGVKEVLLITRGDSPH